MTAPKLPPIPPLTPGDFQPDATDREDSNAHAMMAMRGRWIVAALNAALEQVSAEVAHHRLPVNVESLELKVQLCGAAAGAVTAAQLVATAERNVLVRNLQPVFNDIHARLTAIETRETEIVELAKKMQAMLDAVAPTHEEFERIARQAFTPRKMVPLGPGEIATVGAGLAPPDGFRWETDAELRERLLDGADDASVTCQPKSGKLIP